MIAVQRVSRYSKNYLYNATDAFIRVILLYYAINDTANILKLKLKRNIFLNKIVDMHN